MLDVADFVKERGGNPDKIKESQRKRFAPEDAVDEVLVLYEEARRGIYNQDQIEKHIADRFFLFVARYEVTQQSSNLNGILKQIGQKKKVRLQNYMFLFSNPPFPHRKINKFNNLDPDRIKKMQAI